MCDLDALVTCRGSVQRRQYNYGALVLLFYCARDISPASNNSSQSFPSFQLSVHVIGFGQEP